MAPFVDRPSREVRTVATKICLASVSGIWTVTFTSEAVPGTLSVFAGALALMKLDIVSAVIQVRADGTVTDSFDVVPLDDRTLGTSDADRLSTIATDALNGQRNLATELAVLRRAHKAVTGVAPRVEVNTDSSVTTGINVVAADRPGLLYDITATLSAHGLRTRSLSVLTFNGSARDSFRVVDSAGDPPKDAGLLGALRDELVRVCAG